MIGEDAAGARIADDAHAVPSDAFESAMDDLIAATMALASAIAKLAFLKGWRLRGVLERALGRAQTLGEQLPDGGKSSDALHQLAEMHAIATRLLMSAPAPSAAAIAGVDAGDATLWNEEARVWLAGRSARGGDQIPAPRLPLDDRDSLQARRDVPEMVCELRAAGVASEPASSSGPETKKAGAQ